MREICTSGSVGGRVGDGAAYPTDDEVSDDELTAEWESSLGSGEFSPEPLLGAGGGEAHDARALFEEPSTLRSDEPTSKHEHLADADADARRAQAPRAASVPRSVLTPAMLSRAARKVRAPKLGARPRRPRGKGFTALRAERLAIERAAAGRGLLPHPRAGARCAPSTDKGEAARRSRAGGGQPKKVGGALVQGFLYDGARIVAELDGTGAVVSRFVYVTGGHSPDVMITGAGTYRLVKDQLGSPRLVVNTATGAIAQRLDYDEWGVVTSDTSPGFQPFGFAGGLWDRDTNLVRFGARDYDPTTGRWTTKDRSRFRGGLNLYGYANNDPINLFDPTGHYVQTGVPFAPGLAGGGAAGAGAGLAAGGAAFGGGLLVGAAAPFVGGAAAGAWDATDYPPADEGPEEGGAPVPPDPCPMDPPRKPEMCRNSDFVPGAPPQCEYTCDSDHKKFYVDHEFFADYACKPELPRPAGL